MLRPTRSLALWLLPLAIAGVSRSMHAQPVHGVVRDSATTAPIAGAVVFMLDASGHTAIRTISDERGRFAMIAPAGATRIRAIRIGFQPHEIAMPGASGASDITVDIALLGFPTSLASVRITGRPLCPGSADAGEAFDLWEQARAGLMAAVVAREAKPATMTTMTFDRTLQPADDLVRRLATQSRTGQSTRPFLASATPAEFAAKGYMQEDATGRTYNAPDADVMLDESFAATHCLHIERGDDLHRNAIGLAFEPAFRRDSLVDVSGVLWLDRDVPALRLLEFRFTGLEPAAIAARAGGTLNFRTVSNGVVFIERWVMRMPVLMQGFADGSNSRSTTDDQRDRANRKFLRVSEIRERGGEVLRALWRDSARFDASAVRVSGRLQQKGTPDPVRHALVLLEGARDTATTDVSGAFVLNAILPGRYSLKAVDSALGGFTAERAISRLVDVTREGPNAVNLELPSLAEVVARLCRGQKMPEGSSTLVGRVVGPGGSALRDVTVRAMWQAGYRGAAGSGPLTVNASQQMIEPDAEGRFHVCGVVRERPIKLSVLQRTVSVSDTVVFVSDSLVKRVEWRITPRVASDQVAEPSTGGSASGSGTSTSLPAVTTVGTAAKPLAPQLRRFEERRAAGIGHFVGEDELRKSDSKPLANVLTTYIPGLRLQHNSVGAGQYLVSSRTDTKPCGRVFAGCDSSRAQPMGGLPDGCYVTIYLDGVLLYDYQAMVGSSPPPSLEQFDVTQFAGIEFYASAITTPPGLRNTGCGVLGLWTREK